MIEIAMSTLACPSLTIAEAVRIAEASGCDGIEFRTGGVRASEFACDPFLTDEAKTRSILDAAGLKPVSISTGTSFDAPINPPVIGQLFDNEAAIREAKRAIDLAAQLECPFVRVFGYEKTERESHRSALRRIAGRLSKACDHCRHTGTSLVVENGGSFSSAEQIAELIDAVSSPLIKASYDIAIGDEAGDSPEDAFTMLRTKLGFVRVRDNDENGPVELGSGIRPVEEFVRALAKRRWSGPVVYEWEAAWFEGLRPADEVMPGAIRRLCEWAGLTSGAQAVA